MSMILGMLLGVAIGAGSAWASCRHRRLAAERVANPVPRESVERFLGSLSEFASSVVPLWSTHLESSRQQMDCAVTDLVGKFGAIAGALDSVVEASHSAVGDGYDQIFDSSRHRLESVVSALDAALDRKQRTMSALRGLMAINSQMGVMTTEVASIASQTRIVALNAVLEAERVGPVGRAFGVVAQEVRKLAEVSEAAGHRMGALAKQVGDAITTTLGAAESDAAMEDNMVRDSSIEVQEVLEQLHDFVSRLQGASADLGRAAIEIKDNISMSLVDFQFQDRIGQVLSHVIAAVDSLPATLEAAGAAGADQLQPIDSASMLAELRGSYTMAEEHDQHGSGASVGVRDSEITFF